MRHPAVLAVCMLCALGVFGCGGGSSSTGTEGATPAAYAGSYVGSYTDSNGQNGDMAVTVGSSGAITGIAIDTSKVGSQTVAGLVLSSGAATLTISNGSDTGTMTLSEPGQLTGKFADSQGDTLTFTLTALSSGGVYSGGFAGTFTNSKGQGGTLDLIVSSNGTATAIITIAGSGSPTVITGTVYSNGTGTFTAANGGATYTGTFALVGNTLDGTLTGDGVTIDFTLAKTSGLAA